MCRCKSLSFGDESPLKAQGIKRAAQQDQSVGTLETLSTELHLIRAPESLEVLSYDVRARRRLRLRRGKNRQADGAKDKMIP